MKSGQHSKSGLRSTIQNPDIGSHCFIENTFFRLRDEDQGDAVGFQSADRKNPRFVKNGAAKLGKFTLFTNFKASDMNTLVDS